MENQQNENFANCSQTSFAMRKFRKPVSQCENFANQNSQCENFAMRNFAMPKPNSQCENFAKPISQCEIQFRNAKTLFICPNLCEISHCEIHNHFAKFRKPISHCEIHNHFAKFRKPISHCEIHPAKFSGLVILCN